MIEKMIKEAKEFLPFKIIEIVWDGTLFQMNGPAWSFTTLSAWRISTKSKLIYGCYDNNSIQHVSLLKNLDIVDISCQDYFLKIDPVFHLSNGQKIEIFSTDTFEPWTFNVSDIGMFIPTPSDPQLFE